MPSVPSPRSLFCDWHMPNFLPEVYIDFDKYFEQLKRTGAETLIFQAKTAHGGSFFPTEVGITNPKMRGDIFGDACECAKKLGLTFLAYYNMVLSWDLARLRPEWSQIGRDGKPLRMFLYPCQCMSNDEFREYVGEHMAEATRKYPIDGWFLDLQYFSPEGCFCPACRQKFEEIFGYPLTPESFTPRQWLDLYTYQAQTRERFIHYAMERCNAERPGLSWSWNGCGNPSAISPTLDRGADYLSTEAHPPNYLYADLATRYCEGLGKSFTLFMPESQGSWGDWTVTTPETIKGLSAIALAHGGSLSINHVPYPCGDRAGTVPKIVWDTITETFDWVAERAEVCANKKPVPVIAVLHSAYNNRLLRALSHVETFQHLANEQVACEQALAQLLMETHSCWEVRPEAISLEEMQRYELLILPCMPHVNDELAQKLRDYVSGGGKLFASHVTSLFDEDGSPLRNYSLADLLGVDLIDKSPYSICYLDGLTPPLKGRVPDMPLLIKDSASGRMNPKNHALYTKTRESVKALGYIVDPVIESNFETGKYVYHDHAPPGTRTDYPGIVINHYGAGQVIYLPVPFFKGYRRKACPFLKALFQSILQDKLEVSQKVRIEAPVSVKTALMEDDQGWWLHLIHVQKQTDSMYLDHFRRVDPIVIRVRPGWTVSCVQDALSGRSFNLHDAPDGWTEFTVPGVTDHTIVSIRKGGGESSRRNVTQKRDQKEHQNS